MILRSKRFYIVINNSIIQLDQLFEKASSLGGEPEATGIPAVAAHRVVFSESAAVVLDAHATFLASFGLEIFDALKLSFRLLFYCDGQTGGFKSLSTKYDKNI